MNGVSFAQLDPEILLNDIIEDPPKVDREETRRSIHPGTRISGRVRRSLSVRLVFAVREYSIEARSRLLDKIAEWAGEGGWLTINSRPGQRLYVIPEEPPAMGSSLKWTDEMEMTLTAWARPYWEQQWPTVAIITDSGTIAPTGTMPDAYVECNVKNAGDGEMTQLEISCAGTSFRLHELTVPPGEHVIISYTDHDVLQITAAGASALANRTAESSDDLIAKTRKPNDIAVSADQPVSAIFRARGRYR